MVKTVDEAKMKGNRGFSLIEMLMVIALILIVVSISGGFYQNWNQRYKAEAQVKMMHTDILLARMKAIENSRRYFASVDGSAYKIVEDTNGNQTMDAPPNDMVQVSKTLDYPASSVTVTLLIMEAKGGISTPTSLLATPVSIRFNTGSLSPEYDCLLVYATRVFIGKMIGADCATK